MIALRDGVQGSPPPPSRPPLAMPQVAGYCEPVSHTRNRVWEGTVRAYFVAIVSEPDSLEYVRDAGTVGVGHSCPFPMPAARACWRSLRTAKTASRCLHRARRK